MAITYNAGNRLVSPDSSLVNDTTGWSASGSYITVDTTNNELDFTYSGSANNYTNFDLGVITSDNWVLRFKYEIKTYTGIDSGYLQWAFGVVSAASNSISGAVDGILLVNTVQSSLNRYRLYTLDNTKISGGSPTVATFTKTSAVQTLYVEIERKGSLAKIRLFTNSDYSGSGEEVTCSCVGVDSLRYIQGAIYDEGSAMTYTSSISNVQFFDSEPRLTADGTLVNGTTYTDSYSGKEHILNYGAWAEKNQPSSNIGELLHDHSSLGKQHLWSFFSGSASGTINGGTNTGIIDGWSLTDNASASGSHSYGCDNSIDGGFKITTSVNEDDAITFSPSNNHAIEWVNYDGAVWIAVAKQFSTTSIKSELGLKTDTSTTTSRSVNMFLWDTDAGYSTIRFVSSNYNQSGDTTDTGVSFDTNWHVFKGVQNGTNCKGSIDGILRATNTGTQPDQKQNFNFMMKNGTNSARSIAIRYCEVYNT